MWGWLDGDWDEEEEQQLLFWARQLRLPYILYHVCRRTTYLLSRACRVHTLHAACCVTSAAADTCRLGGYCLGPI